MAQPSTGEILEPPGKYHPWYSMKPLADAGEWAGTPGPYFKKQKEAHGGAAVFKAHPGIAMIAITDHASGKWFFEQPDTVLDRQEGAYVGPLILTKESMGNNVPALVSSAKEAHRPVRDYMFATLMERISVTQSALTHASDVFYKDLRENGLGEHPMLYDTFLRLSSNFMLEWVCGTGEEGGQPLPPFKDFLAVNPASGGVLLKLTIDTPIANLVAKAGRAIKGGLTAAQVESVKVLSDSIKDSKMWPKYMEMLKQNNVPIEDPERTFMFNTGFQSCSAFAKNMEAAIGAMTLHPDFADDLRAELDGQELTMSSVSDVNQFPLLDSLHWEVLRMCPTPPFFFKSAKMDLVVPTSNGDRYQVRKGDLLCCHHPLVHIDVLKFGPDAREFNPRRFVGNPGLKKDVFAYAFADPANVERVDGMPWGCPAHSIGVLEGIMKVFYGRWVQEYTWEMPEPSVVDPELYLGKVGPQNRSFASITPRK